MIFLAGLTILKKERCLGIVGGCEADPTVALRLRNDADYRLPTFGPHGTKLGYSWYQWNTKVIFLAGLTILKGEVSGKIEWMVGWYRGCTPPKECCRLPPTYFWTTWHQTRAFLISVINKKVIFLAGLTILNKERCLSRLSGWGVDPVVPLHPRNAADYRLPTFGPNGTKLGVYWLQWIMKT